MNFVNELIEKSNNVANIKEEIKKEILDGFSEYIKADGITKYLEKMIDKDNISKREYGGVVVRFWAYQSGCSETHFSACGYEWKNSEANKYDGHYYRGVGLYDIHRNIVDSLLRMTICALETMGFRTKYIDNTGKIGYKEYVVTINW